jgi:hypothetical protein
MLVGCTHMFSSLLTETPRNCVSKTYVKVFYRCRFLYMCTVQRVLKIYWDRMDFIGFAAVIVHTTRPSSLTELDSTCAIPVDSVGEYALLFIFVRYLLVIMKQLQEADICI